jgi:hypothetical protein
VILRIKRPEQATVTVRPSGIPFDIPLFTVDRVEQTPPVEQEEKKRPMKASGAQKRPSVDESRDAILSAAQRTVERAREAVNTALDQLPEISLQAIPEGISHGIQAIPLPQALANVPIPGKKEKKRGGPPWKLFLVLLAAGSAGYFAFRWFTRSQDEDFGIDEDWPAEPDYGNKNQPPEGDREASIDAEESLEMRDAVPPAGAATGQEVNGSR